jgi:general secretion pathway protein G
MASPTESGEHMRRQKGFTLIELMVVMAIIATLMTIALPRYFSSLEASKETTLHQSLSSMREALDHFYGDTGRYPDSIEQLVELRYLRNQPLDPISERKDTWVLVAPPDGVAGGVADIKSGASGRARDGSLYSEW